MKNPRTDKYITGEAKLQETFTTGFRRDLNLAREIIRRRRELKATAEPAEVTTAASTGHERIRKAS